MKALSILLSFFLISICVSLVNVDIVKAGDVPKFGPITPINGTVINERVHDRNVTTSEVQFYINGTISNATNLYINGRPVTFDGSGDFSIIMNITQPYKNEWKFSAYNSSSDEWHNVTYVYWYDRNSFPRFVFTVDDFLLTLYNLDNGGYASAWDEPQLSFMRNLSIKWNVTWNCYLDFEENTVDPGWDLTDMDDTWRWEFENASSWLHFNCHTWFYAYTLTHSYVDTGNVIDMIYQQVKRFADGDHTDGINIWDNTTTRPNHVETADNGTCTKAFVDRGLYYLMTQLADCSRDYIWHLYETNPDENVIIELLSTICNKEDNVDYLMLTLNNEYPWTDYNLFWITNDFYCTAPARGTPDSSELEDMSNNNSGEILTFTWHDKVGDPFFADYAEMSNIGSWLENNSYTGVFLSDGWLGNDRANAYGPNITAIYPLNNSIHVPINITQYNFTVYDFNGDPINYSYTDLDVCGHQGDQDGVPNGTINITLPLGCVPLEYNTTYNWTVNVTDGTLWTNFSFSYRTETQNHTEIIITFETELTPHSDTVFSLLGLILLIGAILTLVMLVKKNGVI